MLASTTQFTVFRFFIVPEGMRNCGLSCSLRLDCLDGNRGLGPPHSVARYSLWLDAAIRNKTMPLALCATFECWGYDFYCQRPMSSSDVDSCTVFLRSLSSRCGHWKAISNNSSRAYSTIWVTFSIIFYVYFVFHCTLHLAIGMRSSDISCVIASILASEGLRNSLETLDHKSV